MHITNLESLNPQIIESIFSTADTLKKEPSKWTHLLEGRHFVLFFPETSLRTRVTFEKGITQLGGKISLFPPNTLDKKEALSDVMGYLENWVDAVIVRHSSQSKIEDMAAQSNMPVINAMSADCHPCEILTDLYGFRARKSNYLDLTYTFIGEHANILQSWVEAAHVLGFQLNHVFTSDQRVKADDATYRFSQDLEPVLTSTDVFLTDPIPADLQNEDYFSKYQLKMSHLRQCQKEVLVNPCPPFYRGQEIESEVIDSSYFVGYGFKKDLLYVQQAIILTCLGIEI